MVEKNTTLPFNFYCLSDTKIDGIQTIPLDLSLDLESYWWKICLFNTELKGPTLYFDLDIVIQNNFDDIVKKIVKDKVLLINHEDSGSSAENLTWLTCPYSGINSSILGFYAEVNKEIYNKFMEQPNNNIVKYYGLDRFLYNNFKNRFLYVDFINDWYYRYHNLEYLNKKYISNYKTADGSYDVAFIPQSKFCIVKEIESFDNPYFGLEEFFL